MITTLAEQEPALTPPPSPARPPAPPGRVPCPSPEMAAMAFCASGCTPASLREHAATPAVAEAVAYHWGLTADGAREILLAIADGIGVLEADGWTPEAAGAAFGLAAGYAEVPS